MQITKTILRAYEYYKKKKNHDTNTKIPFQIAFNLSNSKDKSEILLYIKYAKT